MKKKLLSCLAGTALLSAQAQWLSPEAITGAGLGAMIGGIAGGSTHNNGCYSYREFSGNGAAIGAGIGLAAGALLGEARRQSDGDSSGYAYAPAPPPNVTLGYGYGNCGSSAYVFYSPNYYTAPGYYYRPAAQPAPPPAPQARRPNYAVGGTLLGAASGALIGSGIDHQTWQGAAIGAGAGLVLGGLAEYSAKKHEKKLAATTQPSSAPHPQAQAQADPPPSQVTSQPCATSTYHWTTPPPQIPDAPRVPDAPTF